MVANFWYVTILFYSNKLLKLKYIHHNFFLKFLTKKSRCLLWAGKYVIYQTPCYSIPQDHKPNVHCWEKLGTFF